MKLRRILFGFSIFSLLLFFDNCGRPLGLSSSSSSSSSYPTATATFSSINANIITPVCLQCHTTQSPTLTSYAQVIASGAVVPSNPNGSSLYTAVSSGAMPLQQAPLSAADIQMIYNWIQAGAPND